SVRHSPGASHLIRNPIDLLPLRGRQLILRFKGAGPAHRHGEILDVVGLEPAIGAAVSGFVAFRHSAEDHSGASLRSSPARSRVGVTCNSYRRFDISRSAIAVDTAAAKGFGRTTSAMCLAAFIRASASIISSTFRSTSSALSTVRITSRTNCSGTCTRVAFMLNLPSLHRSADASAPCQAPPPPAAPAAATHASAASQADPNASPAPFPSTSPTRNAAATTERGGGSRRRWRRRVSATPPPSRGVSGSCRWPVRRTTRRGHPTLRRAAAAASDLRPKGVDHSLRVGYGYGYGYGYGILLSALLSVCYRFAIRLPSVCHPRRHSPYRAESLAKSEERRV